jgi:hypothetical protein
VVGGGAGEHAREQPANDDESIIQPEGEPLGAQPALL